MRYVTMAAARLVCANLIPYSHLSELGTLSPPGKFVEVAHLLVLKTVRRRGQ